jgi:hypothetical protein
MPIETESEWFLNATYMHDTIMREMEAVPAEHRGVVFPKFVIMYEFFRLLRGEAFLGHRGQVSLDEQKRLYEMENEIGRKLATLRTALDPADPGTQFSMGEMKKQFNF